MTSSTVLTGPPARSAGRVARLAPGLGLLATVSVTAAGLSVRTTDLAAAIAISLALVITAAVGATVARRRPDHPCGWLLIGLALVAAAASSSADYVQESLVAANGAWPATHAVGWLNTWLGVLAVPLGAVLLLTFPTGRLTSRRWRVAAIAITVAAACQAVSAALMPGPLPIAPSLPNPLGVPGARPMLEALSTLSMWVALAVVLAAVGRLLLRYRHAAGEERSQLRTLAAALPVTVFGLLFALLAEGALNEASFYVAVLGLTAVPVSIGWAVLKHGLFDIELWLNRALVYASLTAVIALLYVVVVTGLAGVRGRSVELGVSVLATAVVAVAFGPIRDRLQTAVDRLLYGDRSDPYAALSRLGRRLEDAAAPDQALPSTAEVLGRSLKLDAVAIESLYEGALEPAATWGHVPPDRQPLTLDLIHGRELVGRLTVWPRGGEELAPRDHDLLEDLCRPVAVAVHAATVDRQLQDSRRSLVTTREEERRRLRADLHDGLGPQLAGIGMGLGAARNTVTRDPQAAIALLGELQTHLRETVSQVRSLVEGLAPTVDQLGLAGAIRDGADRLTRSTPVDLTLDLGEVPALPAAIEVATYRIAMEALTNAVRHASPDRCLVSLGCSADGFLVLEVRDDGRGLPATVVPGIGLSSMRQRATEVGGTCTVEPDHAGGTRVRARLPLSR